MTQPRWTVAVVVVLMLVVAGYCMRSNWLASCFTGEAWLAPRIECPSSLQLGEHERGRTVRHSFTIANTGDAALRIDRITTTCGCLGLLQELNGESRRLLSLNLAPGQIEEVEAELLIRGLSGRPTKDYIRFQTNDPDKGQIEIEVVVSRVKGGIIPIPDRALFGTVLVGEQERRVIEVLDDRVPARRVSKVVSTHPAQFTVHLLPVDTADAPSRHREVGNRIGRIEIVLVAAQGEDLCGNVQVYLEGESGEPDLIPICGRVLGPIQISPVALVLPRHSRGTRLYDGECRCHSVRGGLLDLELESVPSGLAVTIAPKEEDKSTKILRVEWEPRKEGAEIQALRRVIRLRGRVDGRETSIELPVFCRQEGGK